MLRIFKNTHFRFMKLKVIAFAISWLIIAAGLVNIFAHKGLNLGVDFAGGTLIRILFRNPVSVSEIRGELSAIGLGASKIQEVGEEGREFIIRTMQPGERSAEEQEIEAHEIMANRIIDTLRTETGRAAFQEGRQDLNSLDAGSVAFLLEPVIPETAAEEAQKIVAFRVDKGIITDFAQLESLEIPAEALQRLEERCFLSRLTVLSKETVGPLAGAILRKKATQATIWALLGMLAYIAIRFKLAYGVSGVLTLFHDVLITLGIYSFTGREVNLPVIAALLTLVGYSINDTIIIFDRIRDNLKILRKHSLEDVMDISLNQTLSRTIITSGTTFLTVFALYLFGGEVINDFAFTMCIGIFIGSYSSIYQSCPILLLWQNVFKPKKGLRK